MRSQIASISPLPSPVVLTRASRTRPAGAGSPSHVRAGWRGLWRDAIDLARAYAAAVGGPWERSVRPSGLVAVVVPLGWQVIFQPQRWMTMMWWYRHYADLGIMPTLAKESLAWMRRVALRSA